MDALNRYVGSCSSERFCAGARWVVVLLLTSASTASATSIDAGLVTSFPFSGNALDVSGQNNHGTVHGATLTSDRFGCPNSAYHFDGHSYIDASAQNLPTGERAISLWFRLDKLDGHPIPTLLAYGGAGCGTTWFMCPWSDTVATKLLVATHCKVIELFGPATLTTGVWYHWVAQTWTGNTEFYLNGIRIAQFNKAIASTVVGPNHRVTIGVNVDKNGIAPYTDSSVTYMEGDIDDVRIYSRSLDAAEVAALYLMSSPVGTPYGQGCSGTGGVVPKLTATGCTYVTNAIHLSITDGLAGASAFFFLGSGKAQPPMSFGAGCFLNVMPPLFGPFGPYPLTPAGDVVLSINLPAATPPGPKHLQAFVLDPAGALGFANSNGIEVTVN